MSDSQWAVQVGVRSALVGNNTFTALVGTRVYDHVPNQATFPYVTIGESTALPFDTKTHTGLDQTLTIHAWSRDYRGRKNVEDILNASYGVLHRGTLSVSGHTFIDCQLEFSETFVDPDGQTFHGVARYRVTTQQSGA